MMEGDVDDNVVLYKRFNVMCLFPLLCCCCCIFFIRPHRNTCQTNVYYRKRRGKIKKSYETYGVCSFVRIVERVEKDIKLENSYNQHTIHYANICGALVDYNNKKDDFEKKKTEKMEGGE